jgi:hypothetical protein
LLFKISSNNNWWLAEPAAFFHQTSVNLTDVVVRTLRPDRTRPNRKQVEIYRSIHSNRNHPFAEGLAHRLKREPRAAKDRQSLVRIRTEPRAGEIVARKDIY